MNILWLTVNRSHRVAHHFDDFRSTVSSLPEISVTTISKDLAGDSGQNMWQLSRNLITNKLVPQNLLKDAIKKAGKVDFIFCDAFFAYLHEDWESIDIPSSIFIEDVHQEVPKHQIKVAKEKQISTIFHRFNFAFHHYHPEARFDFNCIWLPHSIKMERFSDHIEKSLDVLHVGVCPQQFYPFRYFAVNSLSDKPYFTKIDRPKDTPGTPRHSKWPIDRDYDNLLQSSKITITGGSIFNAPVQKYIEIPAANSLLLTNWFPDLGLLGFKPGTNMVSCYQENLLETVEALLSNDEEIDRISNNGYNLVHLKHTSEIRSKQFINFICNLLGKPLYYEVEPCSFQVSFKPKDRSKFKQSKPIPLQNKKRFRRNSWQERISGTRQ